MQRKPSATLREESITITRSDSAHEGPQTFVVGDHSIFASGDCQEPGLNTFPSTKQEGRLHEDGITRIIPTAFLEPQDSFTPYGSWENIYNKRKDSEDAQTSFERFVDEVLIPEFTKPEVKEIQIDVTGFTHVSANIGYGLTHTVASEPILDHVDLDSVKYSLVTQDTKKNNRGYEAACFTFKKLWQEALEERCERLAQARQTRATEHNSPNPTQ